MLYNKRHFFAQRNIFSSFLNDFPYRKTWRNGKDFSKQLSLPAVHDAAMMGPEPAAAGPPCRARSTARSGSWLRHRAKPTEGNESELFRFRKNESCVFFSFIGTKFYVLLLLLYICPWWFYLMCVAFYLKCILGFEK